MKAISLRQPWAHAVLHLGKRVENRDWSGCSFRGPVLLHASKTCPAGEFDDAVESIFHIAYQTNAIGADTTEQFVAAFSVLGQDRRGEPLWRPAPTLPLGGIVGRARIVGAIQHDHGHVVTPPAGACVCSSPWYAGGFALALADVEPLPFIPWKGSLGLFDVPDEVIRSSLHAAHRNAGELGP